MLASHASTTPDLLVASFRQLNIACLEASFYHMAAYGQPIAADLRGGGPAAIGGRKGQYTPQARARDAARATMRRAVRARDASRARGRSHTQATTAMRFVSDACFC